MFFFKIILWIKEWMNYFSNCLRLFLKRGIIKKILVVRFSGLGDIIMSSIIIRKLKDKYPQASLYLFTSYQALSIFESCPYLERIFTPGEKAVLLSEEFDLVINLQIFDNSEEVREVMKDIKAKVILGRRFKNLIYTNYIPEDLYLKNWIKKFCQIAVVPYNREDIRAEEVYLRKDKSSEFMITEKKKILGLPLRGSREGIFFVRDFSLNYLLGFLDFLKDKPFLVLLVGQSKILSAREKETIERSLPRENLFNFVDKTKDIRELAEVMKKCDCFVTVNSLFMHLAISLGIPVVILSGGVDWREYLLDKEGENFLVLEGKRECTPCSYRPALKCRERNTALCIEDISYEDILRGVFRLLKI